MPVTPYYRHNFLVCDFMVPRRIETVGTGFEYAAIGLMQYACRYNLRRSKLLQKPRWNQGSALGRK